MLIRHQKNSQATSAKGVPKQDLCARGFEQAPTETGWVECDSDRARLGQQPMFEASATPPTGPDVGWVECRWSKDSWPTTMPMRDFLKDWAKGQPFVGRVHQCNSVAGPNKTWADECGTKDYVARIFKFATHTPLCINSLVKRWECRPQDVSVTRISHDTASNGFGNLFR